MKKLLAEAKADIDSGISKSLSNAQLTEEELKELLELGYSDLMNEYGLDSVLAEIVVNHTKIEAQRQRYQATMTPRKKLEESIRALMDRKLRELNLR